MNKAQQFWDKQAKRFDESDREFIQASRKIIAMTKDFLDANDNVLDFGCATGNKTLELAGGIIHIHGLDFSSEMIGEAAKKKNKLNIENATFSQGTIYNDDLLKASFDKIVAYSIIHLLEDSEKAIQRIHELLKPGGLFISETACFREKMDIKTRIEFTAYSLMKLFGLFPLHLNMYRITDVEKMIGNQDFHIIKAERLFYNGMTIVFIVAKKQ